MENWSLERKQADLLAPVVCLIEQVIIDGSVTHSIKAFIRL